MSHTTMLTEYANTRVLGIDPGIGIVGFGLIEVTPSGQFENADWGVIRTHKDLSDAYRLKEIYTDLHHLLSTFKPHVVSVEKLFFFKNAKTIIPVTQARGVILLTLAEENLPIFEYTPLQVKQGLTGQGRAEKNDVRQMTMELLKLTQKPTPDDAADALAIAICHCLHHRGALVPA